MKRKKERLNFKKKLEQLNLVILCILASLLFFLFSGYLLHEQDNLFEEALEETAKASADTVEQLLFIADTTAVQIMSDPYVQEVFYDLSKDKESTRNYFEGEVSQKNVLQQNILPYLGKEHYIDRICLFNPYHDMVSVGNGIDMTKTEDYSELLNVADMDKEIEKSSSKRLIKFFQEDKLALGKTRNPQETGYLSLIRPVLKTNLKDKELVGYVEIQITLKSLKRHLDINESERIIQLFYENQLWVQAGNLKEKEPEWIWKDTKEEGFSIRVGGYNTDERRILFISICLIALFLLAIISVLSRVQKWMLEKVTAPLIELCYQTKQNPWYLKKEEVFDEEQDEIGELKAAFQDMLESLKDSADQLVMEQTGKIQAQMLALQVHVNPHFIHNTLAIISSLVEVDEKEKAIEAINRLSFMIRYLADYTQNRVKLEQELDYLENYLNLLCIKYEEDFSYQIIKEKVQEEYQVPKFVLQPLIENALIHSLKSSDYPWKIEVKCVANNERWMVMISDNGAGIEEERITEIKEKMQEICEADINDILKKLKIGGYSMINAMIRLYIMYRENVYFDIYRNSWGGTTVVIGEQKDSEEKR